MMNKKFEPAEGVTLENSIRYIAGVKAAVDREIRTLDREDRSMVLDIIASTLMSTAQEIQQMKTKMEMAGESDKVSDEKKKRLRLLFRKAGRHAS